MAIREKTTITVKSSAKCPSHSQADVYIRDLMTTIDEPIERGGTNKGLAPTETLFAALIGCTNVIGHKCAKKLGIDIGHLEIDMACDFNRLGVLLREEIDLPFERIRLTVKADGPATLDELQQVKAEVSKYCPLAILFRQAGTKIEEEWIKAT